METLFILTVTVFGILGGGTQGLPIPFSNFNFVYQQQPSAFYYSSHVQHQPFVFGHQPLYFYQHQPLGYHILHVPFPVAITDHGNNATTVKPEELKPEPSPEAPPSSSVQDDYPSSVNDDSVKVESDSPATGNDIDLEGLEKNSPPKENDYKDDSVAVDAGRIDDDALDGEPEEA